VQVSYISVSFSVSAYYTSVNWPLLSDSADWTIENKGISIVIVVVFHGFNAKHSVEHERILQQSISDYDNSAVWF